MLAVAGNQPIVPCWNSSPFCPLPLGWRNGACPTSLFEEGNPLPLDASMAAVAEPCGFEDFPDDIGPKYLIHEHSMRKQKKARGFSKECYYHDFILEKNNRYYNLCSSDLSLLQKSEKDARRKTHTKYTCMCASKGKGHQSNPTSHVKEGRLYSRLFHCLYQLSCCLLFV